MTDYVVHPSSLKGVIEIPPSKSHTLRAILFALLADGKSLISPYLPSKDVDAMIEACRLFGAKIKKTPNEITIEGVNGLISSPGGTIDAGNSGIVLRFCSAIAALSPAPFMFTGDHSIQTQRSMTPLLDGLNQLGAKAISIKGNGLAPLSIQGPVKPGRVILSGEDSQPVSALLMLSAFLPGKTEIKVVNPGEKPWVALTLNWFERLGICYQNSDFHTYIVKGNSHYKGFTYSAPGDLSTAAFPAAAALITNSELLLKNVDLTDCQGDKKLFSILKEMGALFEVDQEKKTVLVKKGPRLKGGSFDLNDCIDALPILTSIACFATTPTTIYNAKVARQKECDRITSIAKELRKMGAKIEEKEDGLVIYPASLTGSSLFSYKDHRIVLSLAVAALGAKGASFISDVECSAKTYPSFQKDFQAIHANIQALDEQTQNIV